ncbi:unnamed protein product [Phytophthora lilii]|uniref:Unnamed protein product n=1 Tax=Phytophthora lilii TaxID=2077276 RepID=A0A9W7CSF8_9STRA|nr:unnamed protein product [Phytophthora lilii]
MRKIRIVRHQLQHQKHSPFKEDGVVHLIPPSPRVTALSNSMASWAALNVAGGVARAHAAHARATAEAQDADNAALYEQALRAQQRGQRAAARRVYAQLLQAPAAVGARLEYLCLKNLAAMALEAGDCAAARGFFARALERDASDVVVWHQLARAAAETGDLGLARRALEEGFKVDAAYWPLVQSLAEVLSEIGDEAEYRRVAEYIKEKDPLCPSVRLIEGQKSADTPVMRRARKRLEHLREIFQNGRKRRREVKEEMRQELEKRRMPRKYELQQPSWTALGKVLLEAFEENNRKEQADVLRTAVEIQVSYEEQGGMEIEKSEEKDDAITDDSQKEEKCEGEKDGQDESDYPPPSKRLKHKDTSKASSALETSLLTGISDNDTPDSAINLADFIEFQPRRRKSRRNEERLREEHAAAVKKAREKDLAYRLGAFLPGAIDGLERETTPESISIEWLPSLNAELIGAKFLVSTADKEVILQMASFAFPTSADESPGNTCAQSFQNSAHEKVPPGELPPSSNTIVSEHQISAFVSEADAGMVSPRGILDWVRNYLNQCGQWSDLKLSSDGEEIHTVCIWLEKVLNGELDAAKAPIDVQSSVVSVADHSLVQGSRFEGNGLTLGAQLFLLELHFDILLQQPVRGKRRRKMKKAVETQLAHAQKLLFEFGWREDSEETRERPSGIEFLRLFWLIARMYERSGNPQVAQHYFIKCRDKVAELSEEDHMIDAKVKGESFRVSLPNQKADNVITLEILDEKILGLRFSDVCSEACRLFDAGDYNQVVLILLSHFFPANQPPRMVDFLNEFSVDEEERSVRGDNNRKLFEMVLKSLEQSLKYSDDDMVLFLLTSLYYVIMFLDGLALEKDPTINEDSPDEICMNALAAMDFMLTKLTQNQCEKVVNSDHGLLLRALCVRCLNPSILLRFDSPNDVLSKLRAALEVQRTVCSDIDSYNAHQMLILDAIARLLYVIRSLSTEEFRKLFTLVPHPVKRKQPRRDRIRLVLVDLLRFLNRAFQGNDELALSFPAQKRSALMTLCCTLMKEEEETVARSDGKTSKQLFGNGAILFVTLYESFQRPILASSPSRLVDLIHLLHERLGQHGICGLSYFSEASSSAESGGNSCFLETCTLLLSKFMEQQAVIRDVGRSSGKPNADSADEGNSEDNTDEEEEAEAEYRFQKEVCQCYRCLYDVQILPGCDDHKTGTTFASLQNSEQAVKHNDALRLARFAVPILLSTKPKNNGQKKERLKLLYAVRDALSDSNLAALSAHPASVSPTLEAYLAPRGLLQEKAVPPFPLDKTPNAIAQTIDETCLGHMWYLMGANFILGRVKRRGNLGELMEMEQHVRERVEFLAKDVLYYHPDRIDSWVRLGKTMKELYHAATDAFAAVLGRKLRIHAFQWYTSRILKHSQEPASDKNSNEATSDLLSFKNIVSRWSLFKTIKEWQGKETDGNKQGNKFLSSKEDTQTGNIEMEATQTQIPIEEFVTTYIAQVIEFARRCFDMAARLAEEAARKHELLQHKHTSTGEEGKEEYFDEELDELRNKVIECNEECGLLLYNVLQEFSLMKEANLAIFPRVVYLRLIEEALGYFRKGLKICEANEDAYEDHFRLQYMIGKTLKKRRWCELREQEHSDPEALSTAKEMAECFAKAEAAREEGDREHALVHAFYSLQALRIDLTISESPSPSALRLVCDHFYEEEDDDDEEEEEKKDKRDDNESSDSACIKDTDSKVDDHKESYDAVPKNVNAKTAAPDKSIRSSSTRKDDILSLLAGAESIELKSTLARGWLALNIIEALESIPDEDRYFHPSRYVLARVVYWLSTFYSVLEQSGYTGDQINALLEAIRTRRSKTKVEGPSEPAARALKEMAPIFDKRRPQVVAIWFSEYIPSAKKFEELNQRQMKYDYYRLKYWRFYIALLEENYAYGRLKEVGSWVLACKEEHDVIDIMLGIVLLARGKVLRRRLQAFLDTVEAAAVARGVVDPMNAIVQPQLPGEDRAVDALLKQLAKAYTYYLEVLNAQPRLRRVMDDCGLMVENAELPVVAVFFVGATTYPSEMPLLEKDAAILDRDFNANVVVIRNALRRDELPPRIYDSLGREAWKAYLDASRSFCEDKWPERTWKGKASSKKLVRPKAAPSSSGTDASQSTTNGSQ